MSTSGPIHGSGEEAAAAFGLGFGGRHIGIDWIAEAIPVLREHIDAKIVAALSDSVREAERDWRDEVNALNQNAYRENWPGIVERGMIESSCDDAISADSWLRTYYDLGKCLGAWADGGSPQIANHQELQRLLNQMPPVIEEHCATVAILDSIAAGDAPEFPPPSRREQQSGNEYSNGVGRLASTFAEELARVAFLESLTGTLELAGYLDVFKDDGQKTLVRARTRVEFGKKGRPWAVVCQLLLAGQQGRSREELLRAVWGGNAVTDNNLDQQKRVAGPLLAEIDLEIQADDQGNWRIVQLGPTVGD